MDVVVPQQQAQRHALGGILESLQDRVAQEGGSLMHLANVDPVGISNLSPILRIEDVWD